MRSPQPEYEINSRVLLNPYIGVKSDDGWKITAWAKNVTNKFYITNALFVYDNDVRYTGRPREFGLTVGRSF
jgi:outer membrane receptor protein involved in Fe transport